MALSGLSTRSAGRGDDVSNVSLSGHHGGTTGVHGAGSGGAGAPSGAIVTVGARGTAIKVAGARGARGLSGKRLLGWLSPRVLFSVLVGFGAAGLLLHGALAEPLRAAAAVVLGVLFEALLVGPMWRFVLGFGSAPAKTLDQLLLAEARAETRFDANGQGLISIEVDGQIVQVLGTLRKEDREAQVRVRAGDRLMVEDVDAARNRCTVSRRDP